MAIVQTTLLVPFLATALRARVTLATGAVVGGIMKVDGEYMVIVAINGLDIDVRSRGDNGGVAADHAALAPVVFCLGSDILAPGAGEQVPPVAEERDTYTVGVNGVIPVPTRDTTIYLNKGSALSGTTLGAPSKALDGIRVTIVSLTAFAHVLTATGLVDDGVTGGGKTTLTFGAFVGASIELMATNGHWTVLGKNVVVIT